MNQPNTITLPCAFGAEAYYLIPTDEYSSVSKRWVAGEWQVERATVTEFLVRKGEPVKVGTGDDCFDEVDNRRVFLDLDAAIRERDRLNEQARKE